MWSTWYWGWGDCSKHTHRADASLIVEHRDPLNPPICNFCPSPIPLSQHLLCIWMSAQYAERVWHSVNSVKHMHVHTQREAERRWYRWKWEVRKIGFTSRQVITPTITPLTHAHTHTLLIKSLLQPHLYWEHRNRRQLCMCRRVSSVLAVPYVDLRVCCGHQGFCTVHGGFRAVAPPSSEMHHCQGPEMWHGRRLASSVSLWWQGTSKSSRKMTLLPSRLSINNSRIRLFVPSHSPSPCCPVYSCVFVSPVCASGLHVEKRSFHPFGKTLPPPPFF